MVISTMRSESRHEGIELTLGTEDELHLMDREGNMANRAPEILRDPRSRGLIHDESSNARIEINSDPARDILELHKNVKSKLFRVEDICQDYDVFPVPTGCEFGAGKGTGLVTAVRQPNYERLFGHDLAQLFLKINAFQIHISQYPGRELDQYRLFTALDPLTYSITSTSPISHEGENSINNHRINITRNLLFSAWPEHAQLQDYPRSLQDINDADEKRYFDWLNYPGVDKELFESTFTPQTTGYTPVRKRDDIGPTGTLEIRGGDSTTPDVSDAATALFWGANKRMINEEIPLVVASDNESYAFQSDVIRVPNYRELQHLGKEGYLRFLRSPDHRRYLSEVLEFSREGLTNQEKPYLKPVDNMLITGMNLADQIIHHMQSLGFTGHSYSPQQAAQANLFMRKMYEQSLKYNPN